jgi:hypothetical protein
MSEGAAVGGLLCALVVGLPVGTLVGAVFLRAAVALSNKMAGGASSPGSVPEPAFGKAMWITFDTAVVQLVVGLLLDLFTGAGLAAAAARGQGADGVAQLVFLPVSFLITVGMLSAKLPTTFGRAILVTLCDMLLVLLAGGVLVGIAVVVLAVALR